MKKKASPTKRSSRTNASSVDMLGIVDTSSTARVLILDPQENQAPRPESLVARTTCEIEFRDEKKLQACIDALRESDEALRLRPESLKMWEWNKTFREGMKIIFGVLWYDRAFFESRKDAYKNENHASYYKRFGATSKNFKVKHQLLFKE